MKSGNEPLTIMEPLVPSSRSPELEDRVLTLVAGAERLRQSLHPIVQLAIGDLVRSMNSYHSNLIEGHDTHPRDIERALREDYSADPVKQALQKEAVAHIEVQRVIDRGQDPAAPPTSREYLLWLHRSFYERLPDELRWLESRDRTTRVPVVPGELRETPVGVGRHLPPRPENLPGFLARFEEAFSMDGRTRAERIAALGAAHHRLLWIHPFADGNGRVARLMSHAMLRRLGVGSPLWSVARGLSRRVETYRQLLGEADEKRHHDTDGRGTLSERALVEFCRFFLDVCLDQVEFMGSLLQPEELLARIRVHVAEEVAADRLPEGSFGPLREALFLGEIARGEASAASGYRERRARQTLSALLRRGWLVSDGPKKPVRLGFPLEVVERWLPLLYPAGGA